ncbi:MAG: SPOR domain-containing protein [Bdellovibrionaceae bacterium]|nr:SPOR domain-containing protein [Pseudobdellovibrionaceae bacterium]
MGFSRMGAKTDVIVKLVLVFFISLLSFSIGTFVGKKYSDNQHNLAALEPGHGAAEHGAREVASEHSEANHGEAAKEHGTEHGAAVAKPGEAMSDEEIAKLAEEFVADDASEVKTTGHAAVKEESAAPKTRTLEKAEPLSAAKNIASGRSVSTATTEDKKAEVRIPSSIPKDVTQYNNSGKFTVQVGAYAREEEAQKIAGDLKSKGFSAFYIPANVKGSTWYRVSVGLFATPKEAQDYRGELMNKAKLSTALVQKIVQ